MTEKKEEQAEVEKWSFILTGKVEEVREGSRFRIELKKADDSPISNGDMVVILAALDKWLDVRNKEMLRDLLFETLSSAIASQATGGQDGKLSN